MYRSAAPVFRHNSSSLVSLISCRSLYTFKSSSAAWRSHTHISCCSDPSLSTLRNVCQRQNYKLPVPSISSSQLLQPFHSGNVSRGLLTPQDDVTFWGRTLRRLGFTELPRSLLKKCGYLIYVQIADELDYLKFFKCCNLPDTYASWYSVVELHIWLLSARLMQDENEGKIVRNALINAFFEDNETKSKKLEGALMSARKREMKMLGEQFYAALISYDEGLLGDDYILAGALWRRFMRGNLNSPVIQPQQLDPDKHGELVDKVKALEMLVMYVRSQFYMLNQLSREQLIRKRAIKWAPFDETLFQLTSRMENASSSKSLKREAVKIR